MSKKSSIAFFIAIIMLGSYFIFNTFQNSGFTLFPALDIIPDKDSDPQPVDYIRICDSFAPVIADWTFNGTPFTLADILTERYNESANIAVTVTDDTQVQNVSLWFDTELTDHAGPQSIQMVPIHDNMSIHALENSTINDVTLNATNFVENITATYNADDGLYHSYTNGSNGILMAYAVNLSNYFSAIYDYVYYVNISVRAFINDTSGVTWAGWQIWNNNT